MFNLIDKFCRIIILELLPSTLLQKVELLDLRLTTAESKIGVIQTTLVSDDARLDALESWQTATITLLETIQKSLADAWIVIGEIILVNDNQTAAITGLTTALGNLTTRVNTLENQVGDLISDKQDKLHFTFWDKNAIVLNETVITSAVWTTLLTFNRTYNYNGYVLFMLILKYESWDDNSPQVIPGVSIRMNCAQYDGTPMVQEQTYGNFYQGPNVGTTFYVFKKNLFNFGYQTFTIDIKQYTASTKFKAINFQLFDSDYFP